MKVASDDADPVVCSADVDSPLTAGRKSGCPDRDGQVYRIVTDRDTSRRSPRGDPIVADVASTDLQPIARRRVDDVLQMEAARSARRRMPGGRILSIGDLAIDRDRRIALGHESAPPTTGPTRVDVRTCHRDMSDQIAVRGRARVGCSGWSYADWRGLVYPVDLPTKDWFAAYAERFDTVELNTTFYRLPTTGHGREVARAARRPDSSTR